MPPRLIPILLLMSLANASTAWAQDKGTVDLKPLPPLANPNDPKIGAKELFGRKVLPAAMPTHLLGFYAHGCIAGAEGLPIDADIWLTPMPNRTLSRNEREDMSAVMMVRRDRLDVDPKVFTPGHLAVIRAAEAKAADDDGLAARRLQSGAGRAGRQAIAGVTEPLLGPNNAVSLPARYS